MKKLMMRKDASMSLDNVAKNPTLYYGVDYDDVLTIISERDEEYISHLLYIIEATEDDNNNSSTSRVSLGVAFVSALPSVLMYLATNCSVMDNIYSRALAILSAIAVAGLVFFAVSSKVEKKNAEIRRTIKVACKEAMQKKSTTS